MKFTFTYYQLFSKNLSFLYLSSVVNSHPQKNSFGTEEQKQIASLADSAKEHTILLPTRECESASRSALWVGHANWIIAGCNCPSQKYHIHHFLYIRFGCVRLRNKQYFTDFPCILIWLHSELRTFPWPFFGNRCQPFNKNHPHLPG